MHPRTLVPFVAFAAALASCSGGGSAANPSAAVLPKTSQQVATGTLTIELSPAVTASTVRRPAYVSAGSEYATLWIDGSNSPDRVACSDPGNTCQIGWNSTAGGHTFYVEVDDGSAGGQWKTSLADNSAAENLAASNNNLLPPIIYSMVGVLAEPFSSSPTIFETYNSGFAVPGVFRRLFQWLEIAISRHTIRSTPPGMSSYSRGVFDYTSVGLCFVSTDHGRSWRCNHASSPKFTRALGGVAFACNALARTAPVYHSLRTVT